MTTAAEWDLSAANPQLSRKVLADGTFDYRPLLPSKDLTAGLGCAIRLPIYALHRSYSLARKRDFLRVLFQCLALIRTSSTPLDCCCGELSCGGCHHFAAFAVVTFAQMVLFAMLLGFGIFFLRNIAQVFGQNGFIPVVLAAWGPILAASLLAFTLLLHLEEG
ncbi:MAG: hypothetical protein U5N55_02480 [Cypionkella sp.]|nr:hypothetical protein [Cypionkella sp.]